MRKLIPMLALACLAAWCADDEKQSKLDLGGGVTLELALIPAGSFKQGSPAEEKGRNADETQREVTISQEFFIGKTPVTVGQFARFVEETRHVTDAESGPSGGFGIENGKLAQKKEYTWRNPGFKQLDTHPVTIVTYADALAFCVWLSKKTQREITLPTEAQFEYAARGGTATRFYNGDNDSALDEIAWYKKNSDAATHPVASKKPNAFGLFDMSGNVYQWCLDVYKNGDEAEGTLRRALRGGSFLRDAKNCRSAARYRNDPKSRNADNGFRIVMKQRVLEREDGK